MGPIGAQEMIFIFVLALLLFGPKKLPELGRMLGKGLTEFRRAKNELKSTFESHMQELEREARASDQTESKKRDQSSPQQYSSATYPYPYDEYGRQATPDETPQTVVSSSPGHTEQVPGTVPRGTPAPQVEQVSITTEPERSA